MGKGEIIIRLLFGVAITIPSLWFLITTSDWYVYWDWEKFKNKKEKKHPNHSK